MELYEELEYKRKQLDYSVKELRKNGTAFAEARRAYEVLKAQECFKMKNVGEAVTFISLTVKGIPSVANARFKKDCAEAIYIANKEAINAIKKDIDIIREQIKREWGSSE